MYGYHGYQGFGQDTMTTAESVAGVAYDYLKAGYTAEAGVALSQLSPADKQKACQLMTTQAASDTDATMKSKVASACAGASGTSPLLWIVGGAAVLGLVYWIAKK